MKKILALAFLGAFTLVATPVSAADNPQQERMKACNKEASGKKGDEYKTFMSTCLSDKKKAHDSKMATCNTKSKGMKAEERNMFMSECMKAG